MEKYTVIIPTRDRAETLESTIRTCLRQTYANFEIIVSDNFSNDNTRAIVNYFNDPRIRYINPGRRLSMSGNFEFALAHVTEGFVMFIGSDDGIMPDAINYVDEIVNKYKVKAVSCRQASYIWPDFPDQEIAGQFNFCGLRSDIEIRDSCEWVKKTLKFESPYCFDLPNLYCGFVSKRVIDKAYKHGKYFYSVTPDAYSAFATAIFIDKYAFSHKSFSIAGASAKSNGASSLHPSGDNKETNKFYSENDIEVCNGFISCPSFEIICMEAFSQLSKVFPDYCAAYKIDYKLMLEEALANTNNKTKEEVSIAVECMALNFSVKINDNQLFKKIKKTDLIKAWKSFFQSILSSSKVVQIKNSFGVGIKNIDDAALIAHVIGLNNNSNFFITKKRYLFYRLKQKINL